MSSTLWRYPDRVVAAGSYPSRLPISSRMASFLKRAVVADPDAGWCHFRDEHHTIGPNPGDGHRVQNRSNWREDDYAITYSDIDVPRAAQRRLHLCRCPKAG